MGRNVIYLAENLITGETVKGRSKDLMNVIGCRHYDPYNYARTNSAYKRKWKITAVNKTLEKPIKDDSIDDLFEEWDEFIKSLK